MNKIWYMTSGVPGGEYASQDDSGDTLILHHVVRAAVATGAHVLVRPCPPDLVAWIEAEPHHGLGSDCHDSATACNPDSRHKVPGGWLYFGGAGSSAAAAYIPVAGAAGLTVLGTT